MLKRSERNSIIEDFRNGIINPEYEVKATKTKGRYTVRKRKVPLTDEQMEQLDGGEEQEDQPKVRAPTKNATITQQLPPVKRSKKENALFELQNQLNSQMLTQITELTNKVAKLKAWKKAVKKEMYEEVEDQPEMKQQVEPQVEQQVEQQMEPEVQPLTSSEIRQMEPDYMSQIPEQYIQLTSSELRQYDEPQQYVQPEQTFEEPAYFPSSRNSIDYSKFGF